MRNIIFCMYAIINIFFTSVVFADEIVLVADEWCPYNCNPDDDLPGFMVEIARHAFEKSGHTVKYVTVSWARAIHGTREGQYHGLIGTGKDETPDFVFPDIELGLAEHAFYVKKGHKWKYDGLGSLERITLGAIRDYSYGTLFNDYIKPNENNPKRIQIINQDGGLKLNILKLMNNRIDTTVEDRTVFQYHLYRTNTPNNFSEVGVYVDEKVYIAFSPKLKQAKDYAVILTNAMNGLRKSGELADILKKYGVIDWKQ